MYTLSWSLAALIAPLMSGLVIDRFGAEWLWGLCAVVGTAAGLGYGMLMRRLPAEEPTPPAAPATAIVSTPAPASAQTEVGSATP